MPSFSADSKGNLTFPSCPNQQREAFHAMATTAPITPVAGFNAIFTHYTAALALRDLANSDEQVDRAEAVIEPLFSAVVAHSAFDVSAIVSKCAAVVAEFQQGECPIALVEGILRDLIALERQQAN
jgi:hypothetical protein